jgi:hypothetical protein
LKTQSSFAGGDTTYSIKKDDFGVRKKVWGLDLTYGARQWIYKRWGLEGALGLGIRFRHIHSIDEQFDKNRDIQIRPIDPNIPAAEARTDAFGGFRILPDVSISLRIVYRL